MKELVLVAVLLISVSDSATAQRNSAEAEVRAFIAAYDKAVGARDVVFLEKALPDDYVLTRASGKKSTRAEVLKYYAAERAKPSYRRISLAHENVVLRAVSDMAVITNDYTSRTAPIGATDAEAELTEGRHRYFTREWYLGDSQQTAITRLSRERTIYHPGFHCANACRIYRSTDFTFNANRAT